MTALLDPAPVDPTTSSPAEPPRRSARPRLARPRRYAMCPPTYFQVSYSINPWMDVSIPVDRTLAQVQWEALREVYVGLGHQVLVVEPEPGLPDMVFAANGALVVGDRALGARFAHAQRAPEGPAWAARLRTAGVAGVVPSVLVNEGEGDLLLVGGRVLAGSGFRTDQRAHDQVSSALGLPVVSLELVDPRFYHLDTALAVLGDDDIAWYPPAFSEASRAVLRSLYPDAVVAGESDALALGLNAVSDGRTVVLPAAATVLAAQLRARGYETLGVDLSQFRLAGGSVKCLTMELHTAR